MFNQLLQGTVGNDEMLGNFSMSVMTEQYWNWRTVPKDLIGISHALYDNSAAVHANTEVASGAPLHQQ